MKIEFTGVGTAFSKVDHTSNLLMSLPEKKWMIDFGTTASKSLFEKNIFLSAINGVIITHLHADHVGGLEEFALLSRLSYKNKPYIVSTPSLLNNLWDYSLRGGLEYIEETPGVETPMKLSDYFIPIEATENEWLELPEFSQTKIKLVAADHILRMENYGVVVQKQKERKFFFSGDSKFNEEYIVSNSKNVDLVFQDCQLHDNGPDNQFGVHASLQQLKKLPKEVKNRMWLYHYATGAQLPGIENEFSGFVKRDMVFHL